MGHQSHPVELGQRPEASLAPGLVTVPTKRRQLGLKPCYGAPRLPYPRLALGVARSGAAISSPRPWECACRRGPRTGHRSMRVPRELERPGHSFSITSGVGLPDHKAPGPRPAFGSCGRDEDRTHGEVPPSNPTKGVRWDGVPGVASSHSTVAVGEPARGDPAEGRGRRVADPLEGTTTATLWAVSVSP